MKLIKFDDPQAVNASISILSRGGIIVYPTDTLYGFGVDATNKTAIKRLNRIKGRTSPLSVMAPNVDVAISWMDINTSQLDLVPFYLGGPKTLIAKAKTGIVNELILGTDNTLGIRIPDNAFCSSLSEHYAKPITSTSVNRTDRTPLNDPDLIKKEFEDEIDLFIDMGLINSPKGSTIYRLNDENNIEVLRD